MQAVSQFEMPLIRSLDSTLTSVITGDYSIPQTSLGKLHLSGCPDSPSFRFHSGPQCSHTVPSLSSGKHVFCCVSSLAGICKTILTGTNEPKRSLEVKFQAPGPPEMGKWGATRCLLGSSPQPTACWAHPIFCPLVRLF